MNNSDDSGDDISDGTLPFTSVIIPLNILYLLFSMAVCKYCGKDSIRAVALKNEGPVTNMLVSCDGCEKSVQFWIGEGITPDNSSESTFISFALNRQAVRGSVPSLLHTIQVFHSCWHRCICLTCIKVRTEIT